LLYGTTSPYPPARNRHAVNLINHYGDEVLKVFEAR
jgi:hypothetical protein